MLNCGNEIKRRRNLQGVNNLQIAIFQAFLHCIIVVFQAGFRNFRLHCYTSQ